MSEQPTSEQDIPTSVWSGSFCLLGVNIKCHTLSDGRRIIEQESLDRLFAANNTGAVDLDAPDDFEAFRKWKLGHE